MLRRSRSNIGFRRGLKSMLRPILKPRSVLCLRIFVFASNFEGRISASRIESRVYTVYTVHMTYVDHYYFDMPQHQHIADWHGINLLLILSMSICRKTNNTCSDICLVSIRALRILSNSAEVSLLPSLSKASATFSTWKSIIKSVIFYRLRRS